MPHSLRQFTERLNSCLDETGAPHPIKERAIVLSKMLDISRQQAWSLLEGHQMPNEEIILQIANEFEVDPKWLTGEK